MAEPRKQGVGTHRRRSSLSEALNSAESADASNMVDQDSGKPGFPKEQKQSIQADASDSLQQNSSSEEAQFDFRWKPQYPPTPFERESRQPEGSEPINYSTVGPRSHAVDVGDAAEQANTDQYSNDASPFMPEDSLGYMLCSDLPHRSTSSSVPLETVPEDGHPSSADSKHQKSDGSQSAEFLRPGSLNLTKVRTPRKLVAEVAESFCAAADCSDEPFSAARNQEPSAENPGREIAYSINFPIPDTLASSENPFANSQQALSLTSEAVFSPSDDAFFAMDFDSGASRQQSQEIPFGVAHLDFGARNGSGVVGPKIDEIDVGRQADKFRVNEGEDAEIKQLLWVIENLQEELHVSGRAFQVVQEHIHERQSIADKLQSELNDAQADDVELTEQLRVMHSKLEAQLLTKLEQEEEIRLSGQQLKAVRDEIESLGEALSKSEDHRQDLERQAAEQRAVQKKPPAPKKTPEGLEPERSDHSERSTYSSAWGASDSDDERVNLEILNEPRPSASTIFEENQAKMKEKGALGGLWLRSILGGRSQKDLEVSGGNALSPEALSSEAKIPKSEQDKMKAVVLAGGVSHFHQPTAAAEHAPESLEIESVDELNIPPHPQD